jgi:glutaredoxin
MNRLLLYTRERTCPDQELARRCLAEFNIAYIEINISREPDAAQTMQELVGCLAVPTLVIADEDNNPIEPPRMVGKYESVRNVDRGSIISEPSRDGLQQFLIRHGLLPAA